MTDLLLLLLGQAGQEAEESAAGELNDALRARAAGADGAASPGAGAPEEVEDSPSPASLLAEEAAALRRASAGLYGEARAIVSPVGTSPETAAYTQPFRRTADERAEIPPGQRLIIKETEAGTALDPAVLDRLFERDARRYDSGFTLY